jgi:hypothetical protein
MARLYVKLGTDEAQTPHLVSNACHHNYCPAYLSRLQN